MNLNSVPICDFLNRLVWGRDPKTLHFPQRQLVIAARYLYALARDLIGGELNLRAMSLVYTTLLSLVPLLAVSFSVLKGFGVHNQIEPVLFNFLQPLGDKGVELGQQIVQFVENMRVGVLGSVGLGLLVYTVISLLQKIEEAFNHVWQVDRLRSLGQRFSNYLSVVLVGPVLVFSALGITASATSNSLVQAILAVEPFGQLFIWASKLVPYLLVLVAFTFVYIFIPNTRVRVGPALTGGLVASILWQTSGWLFAEFIASSTKYTAIYSSFAILIMLLIWLFLSWLILLLGAQIAFYVQNPHYVTARPVRLILSNRLRERLALTIMYLAAQNQLRHAEPWTVQGLTDHLNVPVGVIQRLLELLKERTLLVETSDDPPAYVPGRDIGSLRLGELWQAVREAGESRHLNVSRMRGVGAVDALADELNETVRAGLDNRTLRDLVGPEPGEKSVE